MLKRVQDAVIPSKHTSLYRSLWLLGWTGVWVQVVLGSLPILIMAYFFMFSTSGTFSRSGLPLVEYLTLINLLLLLFTTFWSYRYVRLAHRLRDPLRRPPEATVISAVWTGVLASTGSMVFSMVVMLAEAANLLFAFLRVPQGGMAVIPASGFEATQWVSAIDMVSLMALILALASELIVLVLSLWLLFRTTLASQEYPKTIEL